MRFSSDRDDPDYIANVFYAVYLNGIKTTNVVMADEERGELIVYETDADGKFVINSATKTIKCKTVFGIVKVVRLNFYEFIQ